MGHGHGDHDAPHHHGFDSAEMVAFAELEGEVLIGFVETAGSVLAEICRLHDVQVRRVVDLGCGPGVGTCALAQRFSSADVLAVDGSAAMLERAAERAERLGLGDRIATRRVDLPDGLDAVGRADIVWASMVIHHVGDEAAALRRISALLESGGLLAIVERAGPVRVLPDDVDLGRPGLWQRLDAAWDSWFAEMRAELPDSTPSAGGYAALLEQAGFEVLADDVLPLAVDPPLDASARRFAQRQLQSARVQLGSHASEGDVEALDVLIDDAAADGIMRRDDVQLRTTRQLVVARVASPGSS